MENQLIDEHGMWAFVFCMHTSLPLLNYFSYYYIIHLETSLEIINEWQQDSNFFNVVLMTEVQCYSINMMISY